MPPAQLPPLPPVAQAYYEEMQRARALGASRAIRQINDLLCVIADDWTGAAAGLAQTLRAMGDFFIATRGLNTPAIANAINQVLHGLETAAQTGADAKGVRDFMHAQRDQFNARSLANAQRMADYGANLLAECTTILPFDYSSTMLAILRRLVERGQPKRLIVTESRVLDGGRSIVREATAVGHQVVYTLDMAFGYFMPQVDAVLIGAESFQANGDAWNTIGSYPIALAAAALGKPFYVATELLKIDIRSFAGVRKPIRPHDYAPLLGVPGDFAHPAAINTVAPELDVTPARYITAYITEEGVMPPAQIYAEARAFMDASVGNGNANLGRE